MVQVLTEESLRVEVWLVRAAEMAHQNPAPSLPCVLEGAFFDVSQKLGLEPGAPNRVLLDERISHS